MPEWIGWGATAVFVGSYGFRRPSTIRLAQAFGACLWIAYGVMLGARPVILANILVAVAAVLSLWRARDPYAQDSTTSTTNSRGSWLGLAAREPGRHQHGSEPQRPESLATPSRVDDIPDDAYDTPYDSVMR